MSMELEILENIKKVRLEEASSNRILNSVLSEINNSISMKRTVSAVAALFLIFILEGAILYRSTVENKDSSIVLEDINKGFYE